MSTPQSSGAGTKVQVILKHPGKPAEVVSVERSELLRLVGGVAEAIPAPLRLAGIWLIDAEGLTKGLTPNVESLGHMVVGPIVWVSSSLGGLDERQLRSGLKWFGKQGLEVKGGQP